MTIHSDPEIAPVSLVGNLTGDPVLRLIEGTDTPVVRFGLAVHRPARPGEWSHRITDFHTVIAYGTLATNIAASLRGGMRAVIVPLV
jgi:single-stranded DNA-binding protein